VRYAELHSVLVKICALKYILLLYLCCRNFSVLIQELLSGWILLPITDVLADPAVVNSLLLLFLDNYTLSHYPNRPPTRVEFLAHFVSSVPVSRDSVSIRYSSSKAGIQLT
jgi:hypothetical protein